MVKKVSERKEELISLRRFFHMNPEPSFCEFDTSKRVQQELEDAGIPYVTAGTGIIGTIRGKKDKPVLALRADMDALEITEKNDVPYKSQKDGLMHACGHDAHTAALVVAAKILNENRHELDGTIKVIFQPAEEIGKGALSLIKSGNLNDADAFFGIHVQPEIPFGKIELSSRAVMAGSSNLFIKVKGSGGHAAYPHECADAIAAGAEIVSSLQQIVSREISPTEPAVISICQFHAGNRDNIIADEAVITGTVRVANEQTRKQITEAVKRVVHGISLARRVTSEVLCDPATPVLYNSPELYPVAVSAANSVLKDSVLESKMRLGTEDMSRYSEIAPIFFAFVGVGTERPLHHERFDIDENALCVCAALHLEFAREYFKRKGGV
ncbi:peptidase [Clostridia bacterium]|nr:peptidase [Clostridia bacterium]